METLQTRPGTAAVLFDLDGTLIDTKSLYMEAYRVAVEPYIRKDLTLEERRTIRPTSEIGFIRAVVKEEDFDDCVEAFYEAYESLHAERFRGVYPGVPAMLEELRARGLPLGLVTGKSRRSWEITRRLADGLGPFDTLVFDDDVRAPKPDPHGLQLALHALGAAPETAAYVGDSRSDMEAARSAGLRPVAALWAREPDDRDEHIRRIRDQAPDLAHRPDELIRLLALD